MKKTSLIRTFTTFGRRREGFAISYRGSKYSAQSTGDIFRAIIGRHIELGVFLEPGWQEEVWVDLKAAYPECIREDVTPRKIRGVGMGSVATFLAVMAKWLATGGDWMSQEKASARAAICADCESEVGIPSCGLCRHITKVVTPPTDLGLGGCEECQCTLNVKCYVPVEALSADKRLLMYPDHCWVRRELTARNASKAQ